MLDFIDYCLESGELEEHIGKFYRVVIVLKYALDGPAGLHHYILMEKRGVYTNLEPPFDDDSDWYDDFEDDISAYTTSSKILINAYKADADMCGIVDLVEEIINNCKSACEYD